MPTYTLRVFRLVSGAHHRTGQVCEFQAADDEAAMVEMHRYAAEEVARPELVYLYPQGSARSIASEDGLA